MTEDKLLDKSSEHSMILAAFALFCVFSVIIIKKIDSLTPDNALLMLLQIPGSMTETLIEGLKEDISLSDKTWDNLFVVIRVYWMACSLLGYYYLSCHLGFGLIQCFIKIVVSNLVVPFIMPIILIVKTVLAVKYSFLYFIAPSEKGKKKKKNSTI